jgi:hypothetical protein
MKIDALACGIIAALLASCSPRLPQSAPQRCLEFQIKKDQLELIHGRLVEQLRSFAERRRLSFSDQSTEMREANNEPSRGAVRVYDRHLLISGNWGFRFGDSICVAVDPSYYAIEPIVGELADVLRREELSPAERIIRADK